MDAPVMPLAQPPFSPGEPSAFERLCRFVPVIGWMVASFLEKERRAPKAEHIAAQIEVRKSSTITAWGDAPKRRAIGEAISEVIQQEFGWPNSNYLPDDRLDLLMWEADDGMAVISCFFAIERRLGITLPIRCNEVWEMRLGQLVDLILPLPRRCLECGYDLRATPARCPECGSSGGV